MSVLAQPLFIKHLSSEYDENHAYTLEQWADIFVKALNFKNGIKTHEIAINDDVKGAIFEGVLYLICFTGVPFDIMLTPADMSALYDKSGDNEPRCLIVDKVLLGLYHPILANVVKRDWVHLLTHCNPLDLHLLEKQAETFIADGTPISSLEWLVENSQ